MNLARNVAGGAVAGNQLMSLIEDRKMAPMRQQAAQMEVEAGKITLSKEKAIEQLRNAAIDGSYIRRDLASGDLNTAISRMEQRNRRILEAGGDNQHTQQWLSALSSRDPAQIEAVAAEMEEIERAYQTYGGGTAVTDPRTNKMKELEAAGIAPGSPEYKQAVMGQAPTNKMRELEAAGIMPGTPEFRQAMMGSGGATGDAQKGSTNIVMVGEQAFTLGTVFDPQAKTWSNQLVPIADPTGAGGRVEFPGSSGVVPSQRPDQKFRESTSTAAGAAAIARSEKYFDRVDAARSTIAGIDDAIAAIDAGASTGTLMQYLPSLRESSKQLDAAGRRMGLDVVGSVTFGALSEGELALAMATALPTNMEPPQLREWLVNRKGAQTKLAGYLESAAIYLGMEDENGKPHTVASWNKMQKDKRERGPGTLMEDAQGNKALVYPDGTVEEQ
jgi:hypothetical protein